MWCVGSPESGKRFFMVIPTISPDEVANRYETYTTQLVRPFVTDVLNRADVKPGESLLDVACGTGIVARTAAESTASPRVAGVDVSESMIAVAKSMHPEIAWSVASAERLPFPDGEFDVVVCQQGVQFFEDPVQAVIEMYRVSTPAGRVVATAWAPMERCPYFAAMTEAMAKYVDATAAQSMHIAIRPNGNELLQDAFATHFDNVEVTTVESHVEIADLVTFAEQHIQGTLAGASFVIASEEDRYSYVQHIAGSLEQYASASGTHVIPFVVYSAVAAK
jgi:ubiquinone/menaquinone biosynthesis C-methylase UbiE